MGGALWIARRNAGGAEFSTMGGRSEPGCAAGLRTRPARATQELGALLIEDEFGFLAGLLFFAIGAGNVAERCGLGQRRTEFRERTLSVGAGNATASEQRLLGCQLMQVGMKRMAGKLKNLWLAGGSGSDLSEGAAGQENEQSAECEFHSCLS